MLQPQVVMDVVQNVIGRLNSGIRVFIREHLISSWVMVLSKVSLRLLIIQPYNCWVVVWTVRFQHYDQVLARRILESTGSLPQTVEPSPERMMKKSDHREDNGLRQLELFF